MAKLVDAHDSGSCGEILGGSTPPTDSNKPVNLSLRVFYLPTFYLPDLLAAEYIF